MTTKVVSAQVVNSSLDGSPVGAATASTGAFTTLTANTPGSGDNSTNVATTAWCRLGFSILLSSNGYIKLPGWLGGLIMQWGAANANSSSQSIGFPLTFPNSVWSIVCTPLNYGPNAGRASPYLTSSSNSGFVQESAGSTNSIFWWAVGW